MLALVLFFGCGLTKPAAAQEVPWDLSPYRVRIWTVIPQIPELVGRGKHLEPSIRKRIQLTCGPAWQLDIAEAPSSIARACVNSIPPLPSETLIVGDKEILKFDKVFIAKLSANDSLRAEVREFDTPTRLWGELETASIQLSPLFAEQVADLVLSAFAPVGRVGRTRENKVAVRMRAGMLTGDVATNPILPQPGDTLQVVIRKNNRLGELVAGGIMRVPWTVLNVEGQRAGNVDCEIISGLRSPFRSRGSRRVERFAMLVRPHYEQTKVVMHARGDPAQKLTGYDIYAKLPKEKQTTWVGRSDWRGEVTILRDEHRFKVFYVRNGNRLLARLPMVPGAAKTLQAELADDSQRLAAEGFVTGLQEHIVDLVARREILMMRIRRRIDEENLTDAEKLLDEVRLLETRDDLDRRMQNEQQLFTTDDRVVQDKIDRLFRQTKDILYKYLDPAKIEDLRRELATAKQSKSE